MQLPLLKAPCIGLWPCTWHLYPSRTGFHCLPSRPLIFPFLKKLLFIQVMGYFCPMLLVSYKKIKLLQKYFCYIKFKHYFCWLWCLDIRWESSISITLSVAHSCALLAHQSHCLDYQHPGRHWPCSLPTVRLCLWLQSCPLWSACDLGHTEDKVKHYG